ncbi:MAG: hypothetical protein NC483_05145 [Ruminococcus sp.]|nr:hypothetical protein [Ruminococcus sp.]
MLDTSDELSIAIQTTDPVCIFVRNYDGLIRSLRPSFKSKNINANKPDCLKLLKTGLSLLLEISSLKRVNELPRDIVYNTLLLARAIIKPYEERYHKEKTDEELETLKSLYEKIADLPAIEAKLVRSK